MSTIRTLTMLAALAVGTFACHDKPADPAAGKPAPTGATAGSSGPAAPGTIPEADAQRFYAFIESLVAIAVANQDDCAKLAAAINAHMDANKVLISEAGALKKQNVVLPPAYKDKIAKKFSAELGPAVTRKCGKDPDVMRAFQKLAAR